ncbi:MAG: T9SS type A sorting domain-containing protein [bacterium]|nr:MAG: T9SS type A sorting domain-containing protein [bacterium]
MIRPYPDTDEYAGDRNACGPASAVNSLEWLDSTYAEIDIPEPLRTTMEELSKLMNRPRNGGVTIDNFIRGKLDFIEAHDLRINVKFQSSFLSNDVISSSGMTFAQNDNDGLYPKWDWLKQQMADSEDVEIMYYWHDGENWHGHAVVVTGVEESQDGSKRSVKFKHDVRQGGSGGTKQEDESIYVDSYGRMILRSRGAFIGNVVAESPGDPYPTPVELGLFNAELVNCDVHLVWKTESESNNYGFEIFRNGESITFVAGSGTTSELRIYSYIDTGLSGGTYRYELVQIDFDGAREKVGSADVLVLNEPTQFVLSQNYPNPFNVTTKITYTIPEKGFVSIKIYNLLGEELTSLVHEEKEAGVYTIDFNASHLANGIYFYRMEAPGFKQIRKFLLLK